uniref:DUF834 domain-containing protein n=1 Tax=Oryza meridionalis TaxID=40149 RepID=A0A0E0FAR1_9ORYZ
MVMAAVVMTMTAMETRGLFAVDPTMGRGAGSGCGSEEASGRRIRWQEVRRRRIRVQEGTQIADPVVGGMRASDPAVGRYSGGGSSDEEARGWAGGTWLRVWAGSEAQAAADPAVGRLAVASGLVELGHDYVYGWAAMTRLACAGPTACRPHQGQRINDIDLDAPHRQEELDAGVKECVEK